ncbi:glycosyltransferase family 2 protein [Catenuloplanes atrovinosus]|uniref:Glycosyltransferase involved in cell wall biosynthesis n=1 Tax=Catenuloplanes atrovinosus TaxID=137266 RepID=A0AAE3YN71_9ACTN|nr:glycosyltransferase [Catenuloplanes atrovinosus]MDR7274881.1 glycosyltransferase involved in cell wall biosynthesis [Catenuloplanes atrovinosus]
MTLVSVVIPNYNYARTLPLCLGALRAQTYRPIEVLVVDDHSTDDSVAVAEAHGARVLSTPSNGGAAVARNVGAAAAAGELICFLDSDVALRPDAIANAVELLRADPALGAVCGTYTDTPLIRDSRVEEYRCLHQHFWFAESEGPIHAMNTAICVLRARVFAEVGPFNAALRDIEDHDYGLRITRRWRVWSTSRVSGDHDHDDSLRLILRKVFRRTRDGVPLFIRRRGLPGGFATGPRAAGAVLALGGVLAIAAPVAAGPWWLALPAALLAASYACDRALYRWVRRRRGVAFWLYFTGVQLVVNLAVALGAAYGLAKWLLSRRFRRAYDEVGAPIGVQPG